MFNVDLVYVDTKSTFNRTEAESNMDHLAVCYSIEYNNKPPPTSNHTRSTWLVVAILSRASNATMSLIGRPDYYSSMTNYY